jgi:hypothetical protein
METLQPIPYASVASGPGLESDRRGSLIALGVGAIVLGALAALVATFMLLAVAFMMVRPVVPIHVKAEIAAMVIIVVALTVALIWTGVSSIRLKRWVRPIALATAWTSILSTTLMVSGLSLLLAEMTAAPDRAGAVFFISCMVIFGIVIPALFVWGYGRDSVRRTLAAYDPNPSWTERCPVPVFCACVWLLLGGLLTFLLAVHAAAPFFGTYVVGVPAVLLTIAASITMLAAAVLMYLMRRIGWWMAMAVIALGFTSAIMTFSQRGMLEFYERGHTHPEALREIVRSTTMMGVTPIIFVVITLVFSVGYLIWIHRYFCTRACRS